MSNMLFDKGSSYMAADEIGDYESTKRVFGPNRKGVGTLMDLTKQTTVIINNILLGNAYNARDFYELKKNNVGLIINCSKDIPHYFPEDFEYARVSVADKLEQNILVHLDNITTRMYNFITQNPNSTVFVHCFMGSSRSAVVVIAYLIKYRSYTRRDALNFIKQKRELVNINVDFFKQLKDFEALCATVHCSL
tara:strand:+ start:3762 stop:4340 length:579 start_codon:yes stop_codon:yes gene_type:complete